MELPWWTPQPGEAANWDIQVNAPVDFATARDMTVVDLWASVPAATMITYDDSSSVNVPAGAQAFTISTLHAADTIVVCRVGLGGAREGDPDYAKFPSAALSAMTLQDDPTAHFLDFAQRASWEAIAFERLDLAKDIGCDGIEPYLSDHASIDLGFTPDFALQQSWYTAVAEAAHERELSVGMRNGLSWVTDQRLSYDWLLVERCGEFMECDQVKPFLDERKAVFAIEYTTNIDGEAQQTTGPCNQQAANNIEDGLIKSVALSSAVRMTCD